MKLPKPGARLLAPGGGNLKLQAAPGEVHVNAFSDGSSTLPASTKPDKPVFLKTVCPVSYVKTYFLGIISPFKCYISYFKSAYP